MLISYNWLKKFIPSLHATPEEVKEKLSVTLAEVESAEKKGEDFILEIENKALTHRPDCFSQYGLAREVAAAFDLKLEKPIPGSEELNLPKEKVSLTEELKVEVVDQTLCPRYTAAVLINLKVEPSPNWLKTAVERLGIRSINNVVDITNFVMLETGQPLHAFDADKLIGLSKANSREPFPGISVRTAKKGESLITLDGQKRNLDSEMLLICASNFQPPNHLTIQPSRPIALAGIMGGLETEVSEKTTRIILESANFEPFNNRATSRKLGLRTEASLRFEKGLDPNLTVIGLKRAVQLLVEVCNAKLGSQIVDIYSQKVEPKTIVIDSLKVNGFLGINLTLKEIQKILEKLQIQSSFHPPASSFQLTIPTFRRDLNIPQDIYEEIARIYGLNKIVPTLPTRTLSTPKRNREYDFEQKIKQVLKELGFTEVYTYSFVSEQGIGDRKQELLRLQNPISPELEYLRTTLIPSLLEKVKENAKRFDEVKIFEVGKVTIPKGNELPDEPKKIAGAIFKSQIPDPKSQIPLYYELKGDLENFFEGLGIKDISYDACSEDSPRNTRNIPTVDLKAENAILGTIYLIDTQTLAFELDFAALFANSIEFKKFQSISPHPPVKIDLSMVVDKSILTSQIVDVIKTSSGELLTAVEPFDLFEDEKTLGPNKKSVAVHLIFQSQKKSLIQKEVQPLMEKISKNLAENLKAVIR